MATIYRGMDICPQDKGGFTWVDNDTQVIHWKNNSTRETFASEDAAMSDIDAFKRAQLRRSGQL